jgi:hypothetical protein
VGSLGWDRTRASSWIDGMAPGSSYLPIDQY